MESSFFSEKTTPLSRERVRGVAGAGVTSAIPIFQVFFHKTSSPNALKPSNSKALKPYIAYTNLKFLTPSLPLSSLEVTFSPSS